MVQSRFTRRRVGIVLAVLFPVLILLHGLGPADAQFPKPPIGPNMPGGPLGPNMPGGPLNPNMPGGPLNPNMPGGPFGPNRPGGPFGPSQPFGPNKPFGPKIVYDWRCSKCGAIVATTNTPFNPGLGSCPRCGVNFINGGKGFLKPPSNMPPGNMPPGNMPPGNMPPGNMPPGGAPFNPPPAQPPAQPAPPPANAPANPVVAPPADPVDLAQPPAAGPTCRWCNSEVAQGNRYCWQCTLCGVGILVGGMLVLLVVAGVCGVLVYVSVRSATR